MKKIIAVTALAFLMFVSTATPSYAAFAPGNSCAKVGATHKAKNGNLFKCASGTKTWILVSSKGWPAKRTKALNNLLTMLETEASAISLIVNLDGDENDMVVHALMISSILETLSQLESTPKGISFSNFYANASVLKDEADQASSEWFGGDTYTGGERYKAILFLLNKFYVKLNKGLGTKYEIPYI